MKNILIGRLSEFEAESAHGSLGPEGEARK